MDRKRSAKNLAFRQLPRGLLSVIHLKVEYFKCCFENQAKLDEPCTIHKTHKGFCSQSKSKTDF